MPASHPRVGVVVLLALGLAIGGCGSAEVPVKPMAPQGVDPVAWVDAFCGGLGDVMAAEATAAKPESTSQDQKDQLLTLADATQQALTDTAHKLSQLGPPAITDGKQSQDSAIGFFTTVAAAVGDRRAQLAALDVNDPNFEQKANQLTGPDLGGSATQMQGLTSNKELAPAFGTAPQCQRLITAPAHR